MLFTTFSKDANPSSTYPIVKSLVVLSALQRWRPDDVVFTSTVRIHRDELWVTGLPPNLFTTAQRFSCAPNSPLVSFRARSLTRSLRESSHWHTNTGLNFFAFLESSHTLLHHCREERKKRNAQSGLIFFSANLFHRLFYRVLFCARETLLRPPLKVLRLEVVKIWISSIAHTHTLMASHGGAIMANWSILPVKGLQRN